MVNRWRVESTYNRSPLEYLTSGMLNGHKGYIDHYEYNTYSNLIRMRGWDDVWTLVIL